MGPGSAAACADRREVRPRPVCRPGPLFLWEAATRQLPGPSSEGHPRSGGGGVARTRQSGPRAGRGAVVTWRVSSGARGDRQPPRAPFPDRRTELPRATKILLPASRIFIVRPRSPRDWPVQSETERMFLKADVFRARLPSKKKRRITEMQDNVAGCRSRRRDQRKQPDSRAPSPLRPTCGKISNKQTYLKVGKCQLPLRSMGITRDGARGVFRKKESVLFRDEARATRGRRLSKPSHGAVFMPRWAASAAAPGSGRARTEREWQGEAGHWSRHWGHETRLSFAKLKRNSKFSSVSFVPMGSLAGDEE